MATPETVVGDLVQPLAAQDLLWLHERCLRVCRTPPAACINPAAVDEAIAKHSDGPFERGDVHERAALFAGVIAQKHPFTDGNKRLTLAATHAFLLRNGYRMVASQAMAAQFVMQVASGATTWATDRWLRTQTMECLPVSNLAEAWVDVFTRYKGAMRQLGGCASAAPE